jgi:hypothetical protein
MQKLKNIIVLAVVSALPLLSEAQCAVCKAGVQSNLREGGSVALGINTSILYLMSFPYMIFMGFMIYRYRGYLGFQYRTIVHRWRMFRASL